MRKPAWWIAAERLALIIGFISMVVLPHAFARDDGRYAQSPLKQWFDSLRNQNGFPCCDTSDGQRIEDADWRQNDDGTYSVRVDGNWINIPPDRVVTEPNKLGYAVVWFFRDQLTCFMPGPLG